MKTARVLAVLLLALLTGLAGCERNTGGNDSGNGESKNGTAAGTMRSSPATPPGADLKPEDQVLDAEREAPVRAAAAQWQALRPEDMHRLRVGDEAVVLVRGNSGGGRIYGSGPYTLDSYLRTAAVHAGALSHTELGIVRVKVIAHDGEHPSIERNGVRPNAWGYYAASYTLERIDVQ